MKMLKKIAYISLILIGLTAISCASKPKIGSQENVDILTPNNEAETTADSEESNSTLPQNEIEEDNSDLEEPVAEELVEELPELPKEEDKTVTETAEEPAILPEPEVKDEPAVIEKEEPVVLPEPKNENKPTVSFENDVTVDDSNNVEDTAVVAEENQNIEVESTASETVVIEEKKEPGKVDVIPSPSRSITIRKNQLVDINYPGKGWIYQGNIDEEGNIDSRNRNFVFGGRKLGGADTSFTLRSRTPGTFILHFYKNDTLTGNYIDDYLEVVVEDSQLFTNEHVLAPNYAEIVPPKASITAEKIKEEQKQKKLAEEAAKKAELEEKATAEKKTAAPAKNTPAAAPAKDSSIDTIIQTTESAPGANSPSVKKDAPTEKKTVQETKPAPAAKKEVTVDTSAEMDLQNSDQLLNTAKKYYESKEFPKAYSAISKFFDKASSRLDEGLYLRGQILEEKSPVQNIKDAIESYDLVVKNYPASPLWDNANKRSIFLKRFYINIR